MLTSEIAHVQFIVSLLIQPGVRILTRFQTVFFGANDATPPHYDSKKHVPVDLYRENLVSILQHPTVRAHAPHLILITPPPVDEHQRPSIPGRPDEE